MILALFSTTTIIFLIALFRHKKKLNEVGKKLTIDNLINIHPKGTWFLVMIGSIAASSFVLLLIKLLL